MLLRVRGNDLGSVYPFSLHTTSPQSESPWAVVLAGGEGTRLQHLTFEISGDGRPKQFCKLMGGESLLRQTCRRISPLFGLDRQLFVVTRSHEVFYRNELAAFHSASVLEQPRNRGTAVAIGLAVSRILEMETNPLVAFFPADHHYANESAFLRAVDATLEYSRHNGSEIVLLAAKPHYPEVEYGWIETSTVVSDVPAGQLLRVTRFWEKPSLPLARTLLQSHCLWNTFVAIGRAATFHALLCSQVPSMMTSIATALASDRLDTIYRDLPPVDISREVFSLHPDTLLAFRDTDSGWADLGTPKRVLDTLVRNDIQPEWVSRLSNWHADLQPPSQDVGSRFLNSHG